VLEHGHVPDSVRIVIRNLGHLPSGFNFERDTGTGLQLVKSLMPRHGAGISWQHRDNTVIAALELEPPVLLSGHES
jgi:two-component sensor histidine kinase